MANLVPHNENNGQPPARRYESTQSRMETEPGYPVEESLDLREIFAVLRRNVLLITIIALTITAGAVYLAVKKAPQYRASAVIRLKNERQSLTGGIESEAMNQVVGKAVDPLQSQLQVLRSRSIAKRVVDRTALRLDPISAGFSIATVENVTADPTLAGDTFTLRFTPTDYGLTVGSPGTELEFAL